MRILVTGANGMVGTALVRVLKCLRDGKNTTRPELHIDEIYEYTRQSTAEELDAYCARADFVFNLAGVNRPKSDEEFMAENCGFAEVLLDTLKKHGSRAAVMLSSSMQAALIGSSAESEYGRSKLKAEELFFEYAHGTKNKAAVYRFPNIMGHSRPNYNSAVSTFCSAVANGEPYTVNDRSTELELLYIDDLIEGMLDLLEGKEKHCDYDGLTAIEKTDGRFCFVSVTHRVTLGGIVDLLENFRQQPLTLLMPKMPAGSFEKKLYSLYLTYLPKDRLKYAMRTSSDARGSFTELVRTEDCGQVSISITEPGAERGRHWHSSKWEQFIVVHGHGLIRERSLSTGETVELEVSGEKIEAVYMLPGWTHSITNLSDTERLVTVIICNECFDIKRPDTFSELI